jgi:hypothetical protein
MANEWDQQTFKNESLGVKQTSETQFQAKIRSKSVWCKSKGSQIENILGTYHKKRLPIQRMVFKYQKPWWFSFKEAWGKIPRNLPIKIAKRKFHSQEMVACTHA